MDFFEEMEARIPKGEARTRFAPSPTGYMHVGNLNSRSRLFYTKITEYKPSGNPSQRSLKECRH